jgi:hypothetical protein
MGGSGVEGEGRCTGWDVGEKVQKEKGGGNTENGKDSEIFKKYQKLKSYTLQNKLTEITEAKSLNRMTDGHA